MKTKARAERPHRRTENKQAAKLTRPMISSDPPNAEEILDDLEIRVRMAVEDCEMSEPHSEKSKALREFLARLSQHIAQKKTEKLTGAPPPPRFH